jgi:hypothetical protein
MSEALEYLGLASRDTMVLITITSGLFALNHTKVLLFAFLVAV